MLYLLAIVASPIVVWRCHRPIHAVVNALLWALVVPVACAAGGLGILAFIPILDGLLVVNDYQTDLQVERIIRLAEVGGLGMPER